MAKRPPLTQKKLDRAFQNLIADGAAPRIFKVDKDAPRYAYRKKKLPKMEAIRRKQARIREAKEELKCARRAPLETHEGVYVKLRKGSKAWVNAFFENMAFPLIASKEASDAILNSSHTKKSRK